MFREGTDWDSGVCGFRPATEKLTYAHELMHFSREEKALKRTNTHL